MRSIHIWCVICNTNSCSTSLTSLICSSRNVVTTSAIWVTLLAQFVYRWPSISTRACTLPGRFLCKSWLCSKSRVAPSYVITQSGCALYVCTKVSLWNSSIATRWKGACSAWDSAFRSIASSGATNSILVDTPCCSSASTCSRMSSVRYSMFTLIYMKIIDKSIHWSKKCLGCVIISLQP